jgi:hypothetical protein
MKQINNINLNIQVAVSFWEFQIEEIDNHDLVKIILEQGDKQNRKSNVKADMTNWNMTSYTPFKQITDQVEDIVKDWYWQNANIQLLTNISACWGVVYRKGDFAVPHEHLPDSYSFVYYPQAEAGCSSLIFNGYTYQPKTGYGLIFPSYLTHMVNPEMSENIRVVVSGNLEVTAYRDSIVGDL